MSRPSSCGTSLSAVPRGLREEYSRGPDRHLGPGHDQQPLARRPRPLRLVGARARLRTSCAAGAITALLDLVGGCERSTLNPAKACQEDVLDPLTHRNVDRLGQVFGAASDRGWPRPLGAAGPLDLSALRESRDVLAGAERERLNRHRRLAAARGHEAAAVADERFGTSCAAMIPVDHRCRRVVAHAARAEQVHRRCLLGAPAPSSTRSAPAASRISAPRSCRKRAVARSSG